MLSAIAWNSDSSSVPVTLIPESHQSWRSPLCPPPRETFEQMPRAPAAAHSASTNSGAAEVHWSAWATAVQTDCAPPLRHTPSLPAARAVESGETGECACECRNARCESRRIECGEFALLPRRKLPHRRSSPQASAQQKFSAHRETCRRESEREVGALAAQVRHRSIPHGTQGSAAEHSAPAPPRWQTLSHWPST